MPDPTTLYDLVQIQARCRPTATAIAAPGRPPLTYRALAEQVDATIRALSSFGIGHGDRVATILPNGPDAGSAFLGIAACAAVVPLSPALTVREFTESLPVPTTKALVLPAGIISPARDLARAHHIPILELVSSAGSPAGAFRLTGDLNNRAAAGGVAGPGDIGLVLRSSGTTGRPKVFSFTQTELTARAREKAEMYQVTAADRGLNLPPLFHSNALVASLLGSLFVGASLICAPGLAFPEFFTWLAELKPTWYAGLPAMHQAILDQVRRSPEVIAHHSLRYARSASAPLSAQLRQDWEAAFGVPLIDALGSTEASGIAHTPFPPRIRKPGSVGIASPGTVAIDENGNVLPSNTPGEIAKPESRVIRPDDATPDQFPIVNGWYKTGDLGYLDDERYLFLVGRIKELINRGGEKVAPQEVEEQLLRHPAVAQAAVFPIPDAKLGQEVAAAVVLHPGLTATGDELRAFVAPRLAHYKAPRLVLIVAHIPVNAVGKVQRLALAGLLAVELDRHLHPAAGSVATRVVVPPRDALEQRLVALWQTLLGVGPIGVTDDFFALGGDSLAAVRLLARLDAEFGVKLSEAILSGVSTIDGLAAILRDARGTSDRSQLVPLKRQGSRPPLFTCLHGDPNSAVGYRHLIRHTPNDQPLLGVRIREDLLVAGAPWPIERIAAECVVAIRAAQPRGPYYLLGHSTAGLVAFEVASQLITAYQHVAFLGLLDTACPTDAETVPWDSYDPQFVRRHLRRLVTLGVRGSLPYLAERAQWFAHRSKTRLRTRFRTVGRPLGNARGLGAAEPALSTKPSSRYRPRPYPGKITLFIAADPPRDRALIAEVGWKRVAGGGFEARIVPGDHHILLSAQDGKPLARALDDCLRQAQSHKAGGVGC